MIIKINIVDYYEKLIVKSPVSLKKINLQYNHKMDTAKISHERANDLLHSRKTRVNFIANRRPCSCKNKLILEPHLIPNSTQSPNSRPSLKGSSF